MKQITLSEASGRESVEMPEEIARALINLKVATVEPETAGFWLVSGINKVGSFTLDNYQVDVIPKTTISALSFLLGYERSQRFWRDEDVVYDNSAHPSSAIAYSLSRLVSRATAGGVLRGYHAEDSLEMTVRGRWDIATQLKRSPGSNLPVHLTTDEYDADIVENQILLTAVSQLLREPHVRGRVRSSLALLSRRFESVSVLRSGVIPAVTENRLNAHYSGALHLARLVLESASLEQLGARSVASGFLLNMATVFEQFLGEAVAHSATPLQLRAVEQDRSRLDEGGSVHIRPDIVLYRGSVPVAVIDAKYKVEKSDRYPNADVYQAVTYALRLGLPEAHLVYARGEAEPRRIDVIGAGISVYVHAVDLELPPKELIQSVEKLTLKLSRSITSAA